MLVDSDLPEVEQGAGGGEEDGFVDGGGNSFLTIHLYLLYFVISVSF